MLFQFTYFIVGYGSSPKLAFKLTMIPLPELTLNTTEPVAAVILPPCKRPVYKLPSNHLNRVVLVNPSPFWEKYKSLVEPDT